MNALVKAEPTPGKLIVPDQRVQRLSPAVGEMAAVVQMLERAAANPDVDMDKMERLFKLRKEILQENQQRAYNAAMAHAQGRIKPVARDAKNTQTNSMYAKLETICAAITPIYTEEGFSLSFDTADCPKEDYLRIVCDVMHSEGHIAPKHFDLPLDGAGIKGNVNKTLMHASASTVSYGRRYLTCMIFNVPIGGEDNDGNGSSKPPRITEKQVADLNALITEVGADKTKFLAYIKADSLANIRASSYSAAVAALESKRKK